MDQQVFYRLKRSQPIHQPDKTRFLELGLLWLITVKDVFVNRMGFPLKFSFVA